jgi:two-component system sensor histidine kinase KdpD
MRSSLLSTVSHDLRTPLASITGAATALRDDAELTRATHDDLVQSICDEAERLERLVTNLLDMTRLESGGLYLKRDWIPLDELIGSALTRLERQLANHWVNVAVPPDLPSIFVDPVLFEQVLLNLFENACKHTPAGTHIEVRASKLEGTVLIEVADNGPGIPEGSEEMLFEKFYRASPTGTLGAGLGLAICRGIVEAHGGSIGALPVAGGGASFRMVVPIGGTPPQIVRGAEHE